MSVILDDTSKQARQTSVAFSSLRKRANHTYTERGRGDGNPGWAQLSPVAKASTGRAEQRRNDRSAWGTDPDVAKKGSVGFRQLSLRVWCKGQATASVVGTAEEVCDTTGSLPTQSLHGEASLSAPPQRLISRGESPESSAAARFE